MRVIKGTRENPYFRISVGGINGVRITIFGDQMQKGSIRLLNGNFYSVDFLCLNGAECFVYTAEIQIFAGLHPDNYLEFSGAVDDFHQLSVHDTERFGCILTSNRYRKRKNQPGSGFRRFYGIIAFPGVSNLHHIFRQQWPGQRSGGPS